MEAKQLKANWEKRKTEGRRENRNGGKSQDPGKGRDKEM
jgi:hypothetical protein